MGDDSADLPDPPNGLPNYVVGPLQRQDIDSLKQILEYTKRLIEHHENVNIEKRVRESADENEKVMDVVTNPPDNAADELRMKACNRDSCSSCPHGPYLYRRWWDGEGVKEEYLGRPEDVPEDVRLGE